MVVHKYAEETILHGHSASITVVSFSPNGQYLASASEDGVILVFSTTSWKAKKHYVDISPVSALTWHPTFLNTIICGCKNGDIITLCFDHNDRGMSHKKVWVDGTDGPIECICCDHEGRRVVFGHGNKVSMADQITISSWTELRRLPDPPPFLGVPTPMPPPKARSIHFDGDAKRLIVSYLDHGIVCYDVQSLIIIWKIVPRTCHIGRSALSLDEKHVVVSNLYDGLDWYSTTDRALSHTIQCPINQQMNHPVPVILTRDGSATIVGGTCGSARILDTRTSETVQTLPHDGDVIQALDHCVLPDGDSLIAAGVSYLGEETTIKVWISQVEDTPQKDCDSKHQDVGVSSQEQTHGLQRLMNGFFFAVTILCLFLIVRGRDLNFETFRQNLWGLTGVGGGDPNPPSSQPSV